MVSTRAKARQSVSGSDNVDTIAITSPQANKRRSSTTANAATVSPSRSSSSKATQLNLQIIYLIRVVCCNMVIGIHVWLAVVIFLGTNARNVTKASLLLRIAATGATGVDVFFFLSGMFAAYQLIPQFTIYTTQTTHTPFGIFKKTILPFWLHKLWKLAPAYYIIIGLATYEHQQPLDSLLPQYPDARIMRMVTNYWCPHGLTRSLLFLSNAAVPKVCAAQTWSTSVTMQFFFVFPLVLILLQHLSTSFGSNIATKNKTTKASQYRKVVIYTMIAAALASSVYRWKVVSEVGLTTPNHWLVWSEQPTPPTLFKQMLGFQRKYSVSSISRIPNFALGVIIGTLLSSSSKESITWLKSKRRGISAAALISSVLYCGVILSPRAFDSFNVWQPTYLVYLYHSQVRYGSVLLSLIIALIVLSLVLVYHPPRSSKTGPNSSSGVGSGSYYSKQRSLSVLITSIVSSKRVSPIVTFLSAVSYEMYLVHPSVMYWLARYVSPSPVFWRELVEKSPVVGFVVVLTATWSLSLVAGVCLKTVVDAVKRVLEGSFKGVLRVLYGGKRKEMRRKKVS